MEFTIPHALRTILETLKTAILGAPAVAQRDPKQHLVTGTILPQKGLKDPALLQHRLQQQLGSDPWSGNSTCWQRGQKWTNKTATLNTHQVLIQMIQKWALVSVFKKKKKKTLKHSLVAWQVKDPALSLLWLGLLLWHRFEAWLRNFCMPRLQQNKI